MGIVDFVKIRCRRDLFLGVGRLHVFDVDDNTVGDVVGDVEQRIVLFFEWILQGDRGIQVINW